MCRATCWPCAFWPPSTASLRLVWLSARCARLRSGVPRCAPRFRASGSPRWFPSWRRPSNLLSLFLAVGGLFAVSLRGAVVLALGRCHRRRLRLRPRATLSGGGLIGAHGGEYVGVGAVFLATAAALRCVGARAVGQVAANRHTGDPTQKHQQRGEGGEYGELVDQATGVQRLVEHPDQPRHRAADHPGHQAGQQPRHRQISAAIRVRVSRGVGAPVSEPPNDHTGQEQNQQHNADQRGLCLPHIDQRSLEQANDDHRSTEDQAAQHPVSHGASA